LRPPFRHSTCRTLNPQRRHRGRTRDHDARPGTGRSSPCTGHYAEPARRRQASLWRRLRASDARCRPNGPVTCGTARGGFGQKPVRLPLPWWSTTPSQRRRRRDGCFPLGVQVDVGRYVYYRVSLCLGKIDAFEASHTVRWTGLGLWLSTPARSQQPSLTAASQPRLADLLERSNRQPRMLDAESIKVPSRSNTTASSPATRVGLGTVNGRHGRD
jgi:hypothetical protein